jgi:hypothetical protein
MTLSRFLRDYLYIPLGGNRVGALRQSLNIAIVMLLGGLWHGANWTFVVWGGVHGVLLAQPRVEPAADVALASVQHGCRQRRVRGVTFLAVTLAWVPIRADHWLMPGACWHAVPDRRRLAGDRQVLRHFLSAQIRGIARSRRFQGVVQGARALAGDAAARLHRGLKPVGLLLWRGRRHGAAAQYEPDLRRFEPGTGIERERNSRTAQRSSAWTGESPLRLRPVRVLGAATVAGEPISLLPVLR